MRLLLLLFAAATSFAQTDANTITISASRNVVAVPDRVAYSITLRTEATAALGDVVAQLSGTGITAANLTYVEGAGDSVAWTFELVVPFSKMPELNAALAKIQPASGRRPADPLLTFRITTQQISPDVTAEACSLLALVTDARKEADRVATAAGVHVGPIVGLAQSPDISSIPVMVSRLGQFSATAVFSGAFGPPTGSAIIQTIFGYPSAPTPGPACALVVQFRLVP